MGLNFGPVIGRNLVHVVNVFGKQRFPITWKKVDFPRNFEILYSEKWAKVQLLFFPWRALGSPYNESKNLAPTPENLAKIGCKFFGGGAPRGNIVGVA